MMHLLGPLLVPAVTVLACLGFTTEWAVGWYLHRRPPVGPPASEDDQ